MSSLRTGKLIFQTVVMQWKNFDNIPGYTRWFYAYPGARVEWDGSSTNKGFESFYGGESLRWVFIWSDDLRGWFQKGITEAEVDWDED